LVGSSPRCPDASHERIDDPAIRARARRTTFKPYVVVYHPNIRSQDNNRLECGIVSPVNDERIVALTDIRDIPDIHRGLTGSRRSGMWPTSTARLRPQAGGDATPRGRLRWPLLKRRLIMPLEAAPGVAKNRRKRRERRCVGWSDSLQSCLGPKSSFGKRLNGKCRSGAEHRTDPDAGVGQTASGCGKGAR